MELIKIIGLSKDYKKNNQNIRSLNNISLSVKEGEFLSIVGESGGGKSSLLHILAGLDNPTLGTIYIENQDIFSLPSDEISIYRRRNIGMVLQFSNLIPMLTVKENIKLPSEIDNSETDKEFYEYLIKYFGLEERENHYPSELSIGEKQKVLICRALINKPSILLLDDPTRNLDKKNSQDVINLLKLYKSKYGMTIIMITSDLSYASMSDRIIKLEKGEISRENNEDY